MSKCLDKDSIYLHNTIIPPVKSKITAYLIQEFNNIKKTPLINTLSTISQTIKKVGFKVNKQVTNPEQRKNINKDIKIYQKTKYFFLVKEM